MSTNRMKKRRKMTLDTEDLEEPVVEQPQKGYDGLLAPLQHRRPTANVPSQMTGLNGVANAAPRDLVRQTLPRISPLLRNQRGRRRMKAASVDTRTDIRRRAPGLPRILPLLSDPPSSPLNKLMGRRRASFGIMLLNPPPVPTVIAQTVNNPFTNITGRLSTMQLPNEHHSPTLHTIVPFCSHIFILLSIAHHSQRTSCIFSIHPRRRAS